MRTYKNFIDGSFREHTGEYIAVCNPATKKQISQIPSANREEIKEAIFAAKKAQRLWEARSAIDRATFVRKMASADCEYGLTSPIYTRNIDVALRACKESNLVKPTLIEKISKLCRDSIRNLEKVVLVMQMENMVWKNI